MPLALTLRQPWASLVVLGVKRIENRSWATSHRGELWVHAGCAVDAAAIELHRALLPDELPRGALLGSVRVVDCVRDAVDEWALPDCWHWVLDDARALASPVAMRGRLKLFELTTAQYAAATSRRRQRR